MLGRMLPHRRGIGVLIFFLLMFAFDQWRQARFRTQLHDNLVESYVQLHYKWYPDCHEHPAVLEDAERYTAWYIANQAYMRKHFWRQFWSASDAEIINGKSELYQIYRKAVEHAPVQPTLTHTH